MENLNVTVSSKVTREQNQTLKKLSKKLSITRSEFIRDAIWKYIIKHKNN